MTKLYKTAIVIIIKRCWGGNNEYHFSAQICGGRYTGARYRLRVEDGEYWTRAVASRMLDLIQVETGMDRKRIRFVHC